MEHMDIGLIALDLDGTLLDSQKCLTARNRAALEQAAARGIAIVPTTGRFFDAIPAAVRELPFLRYAITINGAHAHCIATGEALYRAEIPWQQTLELMEYLDTLPVIYDCYQDNWGWMTASMQARAAEFAPDPYYLEMLQNKRHPVPDVREMVRERQRGVQKVQFFTRDLALRAELLQSLSSRFPGLLASSSVCNNVEINAADANKGRAMLALAAHLGLRPEQTMAFGDGLNDLSMLRDAGLGVAMDNAVDEAKACADCVTGSCDEDGVAQMIETVCL